MTQVNGPSGINGVNNTGAAGKPSGDKPEILQAPGSGQAGSSGVTANVGLARIGLTQDTQATEALAKANESPTETGVKNLILAVFHGDAGRAARGLLPARASFDDIKTLAGALTTPNYEQAA